MLLGLDISTTCVGWCLLEDNIDKLIAYGYIDLSKPKSMDLIQKVDMFIDKFFKDIFDFLDEIKNIAIEEPVKVFATQKSTATTIMKLAMFNFVLCYELYKKLGIKPIYINANHARKLFGLKFPRNTNSKQKKEIIRQNVAIKYPMIKWPEKKTGGYKSFCYDIADSIVLGTAAKIKLRNEQNSNKEENII